MADLIREHMKAVVAPEMRSLRATIDARDKRIAELERERLAVTNDEIRALLAEWLRQRSYSADLYQRTRAAMRALARGTN